MTQRSDTLDLLTAHHLDLLENSCATFTPDECWKLVVVQEDLLLDFLLLAHHTFLAERALPALLLYG